jgi:limonene 1,2-monooxygenase
VPELDWPLRFGIFLAPFHRAGQNPTLALQQDVELIQHLDALGYDEAWIGEHHSAGWEIISSPEVFIAHVAQVTRHIKLGTGVVSLPYHHPLLVADRMVLLDHLTRGRVMFGVGPGQLTSDAHMLGIEPGEQRRMMAESLEVITALLRGETVTRETDWFTIVDGRLQLSPYTHPCFEVCVAASISPAGPQLAARMGAGLVSVAATQEQGFDAVGYHWGVMEEVAEAHGQTVDRRQWRLMGPMHIAETVEQAKEEVRYGLYGVEDYLRKHIMWGDRGDMSFDEYVDHRNATGGMIIGTPDMAVRQIERLIEQSGGFGCYLFMGADWADPAATKRSYELFAREVMPHFKKQSRAPLASNAWTEGAGDRWSQAAGAAIGAAMQAYEESKAGASQG